MRKSIQNHPIWFILFAAVVCMVFAYALAGHLVKTSILKPPAHDETQIATDSAKQNASKKSASPMLWFEPPESYRRTLSGYPPNDWAQLFTDTAAWQDVIPHVEVFGISAYTAATMNASDLKTLIAFLAEHKMLLAVGADVVPAQAACGAGEGYGGLHPTKQLVDTLTRIKDSGGSVAFIDMDEPLVNGHEELGGKRNRQTHAFVPSCRYTPQQVAQAAAAAYEAARALFPNVQMAQSEAVSDRKLQTSEWIPATESYLQSFKQDTGVSIALVMMDVDWQGGYQDQMAALAAYLRGADTKVGIIYNGLPGDAPSMSDRAWTDAAIAHYKAVELTLHLTPDVAAFTSWQLDPHYLLPETTPGTLTYLMRQYVLFENGGA